jgi:hypothetical protein
MTNPYKHIRNWIKGEVMRLNALLEAITKKEAIEGKKINSMKTLKEKKSTVEKMNSGKFVFGAMFKGTAGKASEAQKILGDIG